ncbi:MAG TPA: response regulator [Verrucomicrobia bacterium]|nr:response regulator [Verrucomicrobiota bacterium]
MRAAEVFVLENAAWPALLVNDAGTILRRNQAAARVFGQALEGQAPLLTAIWAPENGTTPEQFIAQWERSPSATAPLKLRVKGGTVQTFQVSICSFQRDTQRFLVFQLLSETDARSTDANLAQRQKLEVALQLARSVSLDFNNALTSILGYTSLVLSQMEPDNPWRHLLVEVEKSAARAAEIANDLGTFSRQEKETRPQAGGNLNSVLQRSVDVFRNSDAKKLNWVMQLERRLFVVRFDEAKLQQAFVKVIENAVQAVPPGGRITLVTRNVDLKQETQDRELRLAPGTYVCAEISDNGTGIPPDVLPRVFEPFFTTKKAQGHRGLGLALVYGIAANHGGGVSISSHVNVGTSVRLYLPAEPRVVFDTVISHRDLKGTETILMVDDEDLLLSMGETILSSYGYRVLTASSGQRALELFSQHVKEIALVITDLVMPTMSGRELAENIHRVSPETPVLFTSGFVRPQNQNDELTYLQKPFTSQDLLIKIKTVLSGTIS